MRKDIINRKNEILAWISENKSKAFICRELNCKPETFNFYLTKLSIDYEGNQAGIGLFKSKVPLEDIITNKVPFSDNTSLKKRLIHEGLMINECDECGNDGVWNDKPITLELDHKNGDRFDNRLKNLRLLCPNCHSQTPTFRKKKGKA